MGSLIKRVYVDNFRCLVNFEWMPTAECIVLGANGSGKSSALDAIRLIQAWVCGWNGADELVDAEELTEWQSSSLIHFELEARVGDLDLSYSVEFDSSRDLRKVRVVQESLKEGELKLIERDKASVQLYRDTGSSGGTFPLSWSQSAIAAVEPSDVNKKLQRFRDYLGRVLVVRPLPFLFEPESRSEEGRPDVTLRNLISWYRRVASNQKAMTTLRDLLKDVWPEFDYVNLQDVGRDAKAMELVFEQNGRTTGEVRVPMQRLSDGERMLLALYLIASYQRLTPVPVLYVDEPDNFLSLSEIQPWLMRMLNDRPDDGQLVVVSHSPEVIETMGEERGVWFSRTDHFSPTRVRPVTRDETGLTLSERIARGWIDA